jgi:HEAT repeat protein
MESIEAIGSSGDARAADVVVQATRDTDPDVRASAARALAGIRTDRARDTLIEMTRNGGDEDRRAAVESLSRFGDPASTARVREMLRDANPSVAITAIEMVGRLEENHDTLRALVANPATASDVRAAAESYLRAYSADRSGEYSFAYESEE